VSAGDRVEAVRRLSMAAEAGRLYGVGHARWSAALETAWEAVRLAVAGGEVTVSRVREGLIVNGRIVCEPWARACEMFAAATDGGTMAVVLGAGVCREDVRWLAAEARGAGPWTRSPRGGVVRARLAGGGVGEAESCGGGATWVGGAVAGSPAGSGAGGSSDATDPVRGAWTRILAGDKRISDDVSTLAARISAGVLAGGGGLLPLLALKGHDEYTYVHAVNVGLIASALAQATGAGGELLQQITEAALLHDVGKRLVPLRVLSKPDKLGEAERSVVQRHPALGASLLSGVRGVGELAVVAAYEHHMRVDGGGYPRRRRARPPALSSQLIQIADIYDALRSDRPYRAGLSNERCLEILADESGRAFDADLFAVFRDRVIGRIAAAPADAAAGEGARVRAA